MADIYDRSYMPDVDELGELIGSEAFVALHGCMTSDYRALIRIEYSGDSNLSGWNIKYRKAGRTLCTVYPRDGHFYLLLVVGRREKPRVEELLPSLSEDFRAVYRDTREGMGQRWLLFDVAGQTALLDDILKVVRIRRDS